MKETDFGDHKEMWQLYLIGYIAWKFPGFSTLTKFISSSWNNKANFTMHDTD